jgi:hypothetical protein
MSIEQLVCVCVGFIVQSATFALGILVGASLVKRKEPDHGPGTQAAEQTR